MEKTPIWVSQNFLTSKKIIQKLICKTSIHANDHVIEIGPGKGHITGMLLQHCRKVSAIELDQKLYDRLLSKYSKCGNLSLYHKDFMKWNLPVNGEYKIFSNIPFSHTTDILRRLTECKNPPQEAWIIMEKGAAKRFMGLPGENLRSLMTKPMYDMRIVHFFRREDFHPMPKVDVVMVHFKKKPICDILAAEWRNYQGFITIGLKDKAGLLSLLTKRQLSRACKIAGVSDLVSAEILYIQWLCLFRCYREYLRR